MHGTGSSVDYIGTCAAVLAGKADIAGGRVKTIPLESSAQYGVVLAAEQFSRVPSSSLATRFPVSFSPSAFPPSLIWIRSSNPRSRLSSVPRAASQWKRSLLGYLLGGFS